MFVITIDLIQCHQGLCCWSQHRGFKNKLLIWNQMTLDRKLFTFCAAYNVYNLQKHWNFFTLKNILFGNDQVIIFFFNGFFCIRLNLLVISFKTHSELVKKRVDCIYLQSTYLPIILHAGIAHLLLKTKGDDIKWSD